MSLDARTLDQIWSNYPQLAKEHQRQLERERQLTLEVASQDSQNSKSDQLTMVSPLERNDMLYFLVLELLSLEGKEEEELAIKLKAEVESQSDNGGNVQVSAELKREVVAYLLEKLS